MSNKTSRRVVITQRFFDPASIEYLEHQNCDVVVAEPAPGRGDGDLTHEELIALLDGAAGWIVGHARVTRALLRALPELQIVSRRGVGFERVDIQAATDLGRVVAIAAGGNDASVADHTIGMMLSLGRRFRESQANMEAGKWGILIGSDLFEKTVGVIGLGRIGKSVIKRLSGFEAKVLVHTTHPDAAYARDAGVEFVSLPDLLERSDYVTVHAPYNEQTRFLIDTKALRQMKKSAFLINTGRGGLVEDGDLLKALEEGEIAGAGLDVFMSESDPTYKPITDALLARPDVVATPHAGASSREGLDRTNMVAAQAVVAVLDGRTPRAECVVADGREASAA